MSISSQTAIMECSFIFYNKKDKKYADYPPILQTAP